MQLMRKLYPPSLLVASVLLCCGSPLGAAGSWEALRTVALGRIAGTSYRQVFGSEGPQTDLYSCGARISLLDGDDPYADIADLVVWLELLSRDLRARGVSEVGRVHLERLESYGRQRLAAIEAGRSRTTGPWPQVNESTLRSLARALNTALGRNIYIVEGGCGAGEIEVRFRLPGGSRAMIINSFRYELCMVRNVDPQDTTACYGWKQVTGVPMYLSGGYRYVVARPGGGRSSGEFVVDQRRFASLLSESRPYVIELR